MVNLHINRYTLSIAIILILLLHPCLAGPTHAQLLQVSPTEEKEEAPPVEWPEDSLGRRNPHGTVSGFIRALAEENYKRAARYVHFTRPLPAEKKEQIVITLQRLLDENGHIMPYSWISDDTSGHRSDDMPPGVDRIGTIDIHGEAMPLTVEEIKDPNGAPVWLLSSGITETIAGISDPDEGTVPLVERILPEWLKTNRWAGVSAGQWLVLLFLAVAAYFVARVVTAFILFLVPRVWKKSAREPTAGVMRAFAVPVRICIALALFLAAGKALEISFVLRQRFSDLTFLVGLVALLLPLWRLTDFITSYTQRRLTSLSRQGGVSAILFFRRLSKIAIVVLGIIVFLAAVGVDVTTGLAALGIGGLALALGAQKTMENFVGGVTLIADQPIRVGDFCKAGDILGTVEGIGMRSTRIRTLDDTVVTIPNGELSSDVIENFAHRKKFRFFSVVGLRYETTSDQMRFLLVQLRSILSSHPKVDPDPARIRFIELGSSALNVEIFAYIDAADFDDFLEIREELLLRIMDAVRDSGTGLAFPSQTLYLSRDKGVSERRRPEPKNA